MAGSISYVLACDPSCEGPLSLQELSAITIAVDTWRRKLDKRTSRKSKRYQRYSRKRRSVKCILPKTPGVINDIIRQYCKVFEHSMTHWLRDHSKKAFKLRYNRQDGILNDFGDFVIDHTGAIDDTETAKRMLQCNRLSADVKFVIACLYSFEDDIRRIWPSISDDCDEIMLNLGKVDTSVKLLVNTWIMSINVTRLEQAVVAVGNQVRIIQQNMVNNLAMVENLVAWWNRR